MGSYIGIDVSKGHLDVAAMRGRGEVDDRRLTNTEEGVQELVEFVTERDPALVVLESTGAYHRGALAALSAAGLPVALLNPAQLKAFRETLGGRNKTDKQDARLLARFARTYDDQLRRYEPPSEDRQRLKALLRYREGLTKLRTQLIGQMEAARHGGDAEVAELLEVKLREVQAWLEEAKARIESSVEQSPRARVLTGIKGVGPMTAAAVLSYLPEQVLGDPKAAACYAGVHPSIEASGRSYKSKMSKKGCPKLRKYLYMGAMAAIRSNLELRSYYQRLLGRAKAKMQALVAVMHKLLRQMMGRLRAYLAPATPLAA